MEPTRRDTLRFALLGLAVLAGAGTLTACSDEPGSAGGAPSAPELDGIELVSSDVERSAGDPTALPLVEDGLIALAASLYAGLEARSSDTDNLILSPYSVLVALGMTVAGAAGTTAEEMDRILGVGDLGEGWHAGVNAMTAAIDALAGPVERSDGSEAEIELATANQLFGQTGVGWSADFLDLLAREYGAALRAVDYETDPEAARVLINDWVELQTNDKIVDLLPEGVIDTSTRLVLVNAIHLKAPWEQPFEKTLTAPGAFTRLDGTTVQADLMRRSDVTGVVTAGAGWTAATVPYAGQSLAMTLVLPDAGRFNEIEGLVASGTLSPSRGATSPASVIDLSLPKWSFRTSVSLADLLVELGMPTAFGFGDDPADFTPMTDEDLDLVISDVVHQAFIAVDEEGTEAAAATAVVMAETSAPIAEPFVVDRPFLFVLHDVEFGTPLFLGRVVDPTG